MHRHLVPTYLCRPEYVLTLPCARQPGSQVRVPLIIHPPTPLRVPTLWPSVPRTTSTAQTDGQIHHPCPPAIKHSPRPTQLLVGPLESWVACSPWPACHPTGLQCHDDSRHYGTASHEWVTNVYAQTSRQSPRVPDTHGTCHLLSAVAWVDVPTHDACGGLGRF